MTLDEMEQLWRAFVRESHGRIPTHLLVPPLVGIALRDQITLYGLRAYGAPFVAADGKFRVKNALVISSPYIEKPTFVYALTPKC